MSGRGKSQKSLALVEEAKQILAEIHPATVRAVCYRLFVAGLIDSMEKRNTSRVSVQLTWAREQGIIPWDWIVDETRKAERLVCWDDPEDCAQQISRQYRRDNWSDQTLHLEVWSEKGTMRGTLMPILLEYGVTFGVLHGFSSATTAYDAAQRIKYEDEDAGRTVVIFYIGDWDPSGLFMSEQPRRRARCFRRSHRTGGGSPTALTSRAAGKSTCERFPTTVRKSRFRLAADSSPSGRKAAASWCIWRAPR